MTNSTSYVTRSELWVHNSCKEALELLRLLRKEKVDAWVAFIKEDRLKPRLGNLWFLFGKPEDTDDHKILMDYSKKWYRFEWMSRASSYCWDNLALLRLLDATDPELQSGHTMQLFVEDSALIEKWLNRIDSRKKNPDEYQNL
jgi:hypothetical protein